MICWYECMCRNFVYMKLLRNSEETIDTIQCSVFCVVGFTVHESTEICKSHFKPRNYVNCEQKFRTKIQTRKMNWWFVRKHFEWTRKKNQLNIVYHTKEIEMWVHLFFSFSRWHRSVQSQYIHDYSSRSQRTIYSRKYFIVRLFVEAFLIKESLSNRFMCMKQLSELYFG